MKESEFINDFKVRYNRYLSEIISELNSEQYQEDWWLNNKVSDLFSRLIDAKPRIIFEICKENVLDLKTTNESPILNYHFIDLYSRLVLITIDEQLDIFRRFKEAVNIKAIDLDFTLSIF